MANKEAFLNHIASRLGRPRMHEVQKPKWKKHPWDHLHQGLNQEELVNQFEEELLKIGGQLIRVPNLKELTNAIQTWLAEIKATRIVAWDMDTELGNMLKHALVTTKQAQGTEEYQVTFWDEHGDKEKLVQEAERSDVGFTIAEHGLAETGTVVLYNRGNNGRLVSLLPNISAQLLLAKDVVPRITQVLAQMNGKVENYSCINFITGPSRSADIEMDLSIGVHGPGSIIVFLIEDVD